MLHPCGRAIILRCGRPTTEVKKRCLLPLTIYNILWYDTVTSIARNGLCSSFHDIARARTSQFHTSSHSWCVQRYAKHIGCLLFRIIITLFAYEMHFSHTRRDRSNVFLIVTHEERMARHTHTHARTRTHACVRALAHKHSYKHSHTCTHTRSNSNTSTSTHTHAYTSAHARVGAHKHDTCTRSLARASTSTRALAHAHTNICPFTAQPFLLNCY